MLCSVVILAAGQGKRMQSKKSKVLHTLANRSFIEHVTFTAQQLNPDKLIVIHGHLGEQVQEALSNYQITWAQQMPPQGTGHAVQQALPHLSNMGVTVILYGDVPLITLDTLKSMVEKAQKNSLVLLTEKMDDPTGYGRVLRDTQNKVLGIIEHKDATEEERKVCEVNTGMMAVPTAWLHKYIPNLNNNNVQKEYYLTDLIKMAVDEGNSVDTLFPRYSWEVTGVNDRLQQADLEREYQKHQAQALMRLGVSLRDPSRFDLRGSLECDQDVEIDVNCIFEGKVKLGSNVKIGAYCFIRNAEIAANTCIEPYSHIDGAKIGENGKIGPFSRLRPGTVLAEHVHIGNFVELKNSQLEAYSKANHLSYLGDAHIGKRVNIGAGTITCNYDGVNKHKTVIEDDVFIGSSTQLVAPLILKKGVTVAAGTTVWKDVHDENALVLNIKEQRSRLSWLRPCKSEGK